jgi:hypothetical protein
MKDTEDAYVQHIDSSGLFSQGSVEHYAGEAEDAKKITTALPAAFVNARGMQLHSKEEYGIHVLVAGRTSALKKQEAAQNAKALAGSLAHWLRDHHFFTHNGRTHQINVDEEIKVGQARISASTVIYLVSFTAEAWDA